MPDNLEVDADNIDGELWCQPAVLQHKQHLNQRTDRQPFFSGRFISRFGHIAWLARSPDLFAPDYFLWRTWKFKFML